MPFYVMRHLLYKIESFVIIGSKNKEFRSDHLLKTKSKTLRNSNYVIKTVFLCGFSVV